MSLIQTEFYSNYIWISITEKLNKDIYSELEEESICEQLSIKDFMLLIETYLETCPLSPLLLNKILDVIARVIRQNGEDEKEMT